jgi:hypothetical protein
VGETDSSAPQACTPSEFVSLPVLDQEDYCHLTLRCSLHIFFFVFYLYYYIGVGDGVTLASNIRKIQPFIILKTSIKPHINPM